MNLKMSFKKNVVGDLKIWKYFRTRFAEAHPPRLLVSPDTPEPQRHKILVILMGHQKIPKTCDVTDLICRVLSGMHVYLRYIYLLVSNVRLSNVPIRGQPVSRQAFLVSVF